ncbi:MAG TPA: protein kinase, partial [Ktedonobacteraceae bacterium]|nr:protein kinase [Ktedonobacteraceae bacterium]
MADVRDGVELRQIGPNAVTRLLHKSSTCSLYAGTQRKKDIAIKVFHTSLATPEARQAFLARAKQLKKLKHRHIVDIQDYGLTSHTDEQEEYGYLVMQYVSGGTLYQRIPVGQRLPVDEVKRILSPIASALHYAHVSNILHGNLHPGNLLVDTNNDILLTDFSLPFQDAALDHQASAVPYMAPEQLQAKPGVASDQYALAAIVYQWLCGQRPYTATEREELLHQQEHDPIPMPRSLNEQISSAVEKVLLQALALEPDERFQHIQAFADNYLHALMGLPLNLETRRVVPSVPSSPTKPTSVGEQFVAPSSPLSPHSSPSQSMIHQVPTPLGAINRAPTPSLDHDNESEGVIHQAPTPSIDDKDTPVSVIHRPPLHSQNGVSPLQESVSADLCQGGILSQSLAGYEERPAQIEMATLVARSLTQNIPAIVEAGTGTGKALDVGTPIPTPTGWKRMGDLVEGDFVFDEKGNPTRITAAFDVMYQRKCYEVVFSDGSSLIADAEHEWAS